jgi:tetraacyldisaccharide 4'-kinase
VNPLGAIYGLTTAYRNYLYDHGVLKASRLSRPVISVGNISVGGAGKTPFVILLGQLLQRRGITFDVLSRGYGRETREVRVVDPNGSPRDFGDEPILLAKSLQCPVIVGRSRYHAGLLAEEKFASAFHILDDGFQHRSLARDFDIVLLTPDDLSDHLLPGGRLREPLSSLRRADAICLTADADAAGLPAGKLIWRVRRSLKIPADRPARPVAFCAIARPHQFLEQSRAAGIHPVAHKFYRDHHRYTARDIRNLQDMKLKHGADGFLTTQKDLVNLGQHYPQIGRLAVPSVTMELTDPADALDTMLQAIAGPRGGA